MRRERPTLHLVRHRARFRVPLSVALLPTFLLACSGSDPTARMAEEPVTSSDAAEGGTAAPAPAPGAAPVSTALPSAPIQADTAVAPQVIIRTGQAVLEVDSLERAIAQLTLLAQRAGGYVTDTRISAGEEQRRSGQITLRVPAARFDGLVTGLATAGEVEEVNVTSEDVSEEFVDLSARAANARRTEERLLELLRTRTGSLEDVLAVEREVARVREEVERIEGRLRFLRSRAALSTLVVSLHEPESLAGDAPPVGETLLEAFGRAWGNFVYFIAGLISALGVLVPLGLLLVAAFWAYRRLRRARRVRSPRE